VSDVALASLITNPSLPVPHGWTEQSLIELLNSIETNAATAADLKLFLTHFRRFVYTLSLVPERAGIEVLELGAAPYVMTSLLRRFRDARLTLAGYGAGSDSAPHTLKVGVDGETKRFRPDYFNLEKDPFPYAADSFDAVLMCEIIEHLPEDPVHPLTEIRRVLRLGGHLILTTPNVNRLENTAKTLDGENTWDLYSGYGPYGRHNREWTTAEMRSLLSENGYEIEMLFTADVHPDYGTYYAYWDKVAALIHSRRGDLGQYMFVRARVTDKTAPAVRGALYRSL
jgi:SAM-dependent methyltransferase